MLRAFAIALFAPLAPLLWTTEVGTVAHANAIGQPQSLTSVPPPIPQLLAKKKKKQPAAVLVTEATVLADNIAGTWYYTLRGRIRNRGEEVATRPVVYYEIYDEQDRIVDAGSMLIQPAFLPPNGGEAMFQKEIRKGGRVKITLVAWKKPDNSTEEHLQLEFFPRPDAE